MNTSITIGLVAVNSRTSHSNPTLFTIKNFLQREGIHTPKLLELSINSQWKEALEQLIKLDCQIYLFSVYIWNRDFLEKILPLLKTLKKGSKIVLGGPEVTYNREHWMALDFVDTLVIGQAEDFIPHIGTFEERIYHSKMTPIDKVPFPYEEEDRAVLQGRLVYYETSRGCLFNCTYCLSSCEKDKPQYKKIDKVKEELNKLISLEPKIVKMVDRSFNFDKNFAREVWQFLIDANSSVPFHFELHPLFLDDEDFRLLATAPKGLFYVEVGIQSTDKQVLKAVDRPWNREKEKANIEKLCRLKNIHTHLDQIVALPGDTPEKAIESFNNILSHEPDEFQLGFLKVLPGTALSNEISQWGIKHTSFPPYEVISTNGFTFHDLQLFYEVEADLDRYYNSDHFDNTIVYLQTLFPSLWDFYLCLNKFSPENRSTKQWSTLGESLLKLTEEKYPKKRDHIIDLLRLDWCPHSSGQNFPPFIRIPGDQSIKELRRKLYPYFEERIKDFSRREYNRSILFDPLSRELKRILFYKRDGGAIETYEI